MTGIKSRERVEQVLSALIYLGVSFGLGLAFFAVTGLSGSYPPIARYGGAGWVFFLSLMITMPLVNGYFKRRSAGL
jgi:hypothetical protein